MSVHAVTHINFRGQARQALAFYHSVFGGQIAMLSYADAHNVQDPADADRLMWGQVSTVDGLHLMAYDVPAALPWNPGENAFFVCVGSAMAQEIAAHWAPLSDGAEIVVPLAPAKWSPLYGMLKDRFGVTWVLHVVAPHPNA